jgi:hypothetical protein
VNGEVRAGATEAAEEEVCFEGLAVADAAAAAAKVSSGSV